MRTTVSFEDISNYLEDEHRADVGSVRTLNQGRIAQSVRFDLDDQRYVFRLAPGEDALRRDKFAAGMVTAVPVPKVRAIGAWNGLAYCISSFVEGTPADQVSLAEMLRIRVEIHQSLAGIFRTNISAYTGFGSVDPVTGNAEVETPQAAIDASLLRAPEGQVQHNARELGLDCAIAPRLLEVIERSRAAVSPIRRLIHGDPGFDNLLIRDGRVVAHIDWASMGYGDWMQDFSRLELWDSARYGNAEAFGLAYGLDQEGLVERRALFTAMHLKDAIHFAVAYCNQDTSNWLRATADELSRKLI